MVHAAVAGSDSARVSFSRITLSTCGNQHRVVSMAPMAPLKLMSEANVMPIRSRLFTDLAVMTNKPLLSFKLTSANCVKYYLRDAALSLSASGP